VSSRRFFLPAKSQSDFREDFDRTLSILPASSSARRFVEIVVVKAAKKQDVSPPVRVTRGKILPRLEGYSVKEKTPSAQLSASSFQM
jgi:hypothetical protein